MEYNEKKLWRLIAALGLLLSALSLVMSLVNFLISGRYEISSVLDYVNLSKNLILFIVFLYLQFDCSNYYLYAVIFYLYGTVSFIDNVNNLGAVYVVLSFAIFYALDFFKKINVFKLFMFAIVPLLALLSEFVLSGKTVFFVTILHLLTFAFLILIVTTLFYPRFKEVTTKKKIKFLNSKVFSEQDLKWLQSVIEGKPYLEIAKKDNVSESKVKNRMLELYTLVGAKNKIDFIAKYSGYTFVHSVSALKD